MLSIRSTDSLYGRIVQRYVGFGTACILLLVCYAVLSSSQRVGDAKLLLVLAALIPLAVLWLGGFEIRRLLTAPEQIFCQLTELAKSPDVKHESLVPVTEAEPIAAGWNHLLQHIYAGGLTKDLEKNLAAAMQSGHNGQMTHVINSLADGVAVTDATGHVTTANHAFRALMGLPDEQPGEHVNVFDLLSRQTESGELPPEVSSRQATRCRFDLAKNQIASDGVVRVVCVPMLGDTGDTGCFVWSARDVTQQKLAESMRTQFVQTATHELRTPLANIRAYAETLQLADDIPIEQQKEFVNIINAESTRLGRFVDELLNLSQMDAGSITISRHETQFERLLQECIENTRPLLETKQQKFETQIPAKLPTLNIDKDKVTSCLVNLLGNASKYTPENGQIRLVVEETSSELTIRIEDTGFGISEEEMPRVFNRFFRSVDARVREEPGSGLGLAYTLEVARLHGGRLTVDSELDKGSQFTLHLPL